MIEMENLLAPHPLSAVQAFIPPLFPAFYQDRRSLVFFQSWDIPLRNFNSRLVLFFPGLEGRFCRSITPPSPSGFLVEIVQLTPATNISQPGLIPPPSTLAFAFFFTMFESFAPYYFG